MDHNDRKYAQIYKFFQTDRDYDDNDLSPSPCESQPKRWMQSVVWVNEEASTWWTYNLKMQQCTDWSH